VAARSADVIPPMAEAAIDLRRDHDILARDVKVLQGLSEKFFALALPVIVSHIKEVDTAINRSLDQFISLSLVCESELHMPACQDSICLAIDCGAE
jgi:hypothetical protein